MLRREMNDEEKQLRKDNGKKVKEIQNKDICPSCYNRENGGVYAENKNRLLYEDSLVECFLEEYPRTPGHTIILVKQHYEDISEMPLFIGTQVIQSSKAIVHALKEVLGAKKVYMCTMCDGGRNHLHFQLIPRFEGDVTGSKLFIKERGIYVEDSKAVIDLRRSIRLYLDPQTDFTEPSEEFYRYNDEQNRRVITEILKREEKYVINEPEDKVVEEETKETTEKKSEIKITDKITEAREINLDEIDLEEDTKPEEKEDSLEAQRNEFLSGFEKNKIEENNNKETEEVLEQKIEEKEEIIEEKKEEDTKTGEDPYLKDAIEYVVKNRNASPNAIQKKFDIGYFRSVKLIEIMEERGIVSPYNKVTHKREVLVKNLDTNEKIEIVNDFNFDEEKITNRIKEKIEEIDPIFEEVIDFCVKEEKVSLENVQKNFKIGYSRTLQIFSILEYLEILGEKEEKIFNNVTINEAQAEIIKNILKEKREEKALEYIAEEAVESKVQEINYFSNKHFENELEDFSLEEKKEEVKIEEDIEASIEENSFSADFRKKDPKEIVNRIFEEYKQKNEKEEVLEENISEKTQEVDTITDNDIVELFKMKKNIEENAQKVNEIVKDETKGVTFEVTDDRKTEIVTIEDALENAKKEEKESEEIDETIKKEMSLRDKKEKIKQIIGNAFSKKEKEDEIEVEEEEVEEEEKDPYDMSTEEYLKNELNKIKEDALQEEEINKIEENVNKNFDMITSKIESSEDNNLTGKIEKISKYLEEDILLKDAIEEAIDSNNASATFMQRKLRITYVRAIKLLDMMQDAEVINKFVAGEPRRVLLTYREWLEIKKTLDIL